VARRCEICGRVSPDRSQRCECGFDFITKDATQSLDVVERRRQESQSKIGRAIMLIVAAPACVVAGWSLSTTLASPIPAYVGSASAVLLVGAGVIRIGVAVRASQRASSQLRAAKAKRTLPAARVVDK
jgi:hypothetical protein